MIGAKVSHYRIVKQLGAGGMGTVYLAEDTVLGRKVALKFLAPEALTDAVAARRLRREARAASALDHPNIASIYEVGDWEDRPYIAMAYYAGETLHERLQRGPLAMDEALDVFLQIASALEAAHAAGIVHRDLKPANVMLTTDGHVKLLDFGLATTVSPDTDTQSRLTETGSAPGTIAYMAPEQVLGLSADARADVWAFGVVLYECLTGVQPFRGNSTFATFDAIINATPAALSTLREDAPRELRDIVGHALLKDRLQRLLTMQDVARTLAQYRARNLASAPTIDNRRTRRRLVVAFVSLLVLAATVAGWRLHRESRARWAREVALPQVARMVRAERLVDAFDLAQEAAREIPSDPGLKEQLDVTTWMLGIDSSPAGATISYRPYGDGHTPWRPVGRTPIAKVAVPATFLQWKAELTGFVVAQDVGPTRSDHLRFVLQRPDTVPSDMVLASVGSEPFELLLPGLHPWPQAVLGDFYIDRHEVTNREFQRFVDAHGYQRLDLWRLPFRADGLVLSRGVAIARFVDATGRPGPAGWEAGHYRAGDDELPVTGVSWFEAAAYAAYVGKMLPTLFHWSATAEPLLAPWVVPTSNMSGRGLTQVGASRGYNRFGATDMAGNAKEWVWNAAGPNSRYVVGGAWNEPGYQFTDVDARSPFAREATFGFRCMKPVSGTDLPPALSGPIEFGARDFSKERPVSDEKFSAYRSLYSYDHSPLASRVESVVRGANDWTLENVTFAAAYGHERIIAHLYLPKHRHPPYQTVVEFPGVNALDLRRFDPDLEHDPFKFVVQSGRALMIPIYKGTFERQSDMGDGFPNTTVAYRDHVVMWVKDLARSIDYLDTRPDLNRNKIAYLGISWGGTLAPITLAVEPRVKAAILIGGGLLMQHALPEADAINFAPRVFIPTLMLNGQFDFMLSPKWSQEPLFRMLATPAADKRRLVYDATHFPPSADIAKETLDWLDRYLGTVDR